MSTHDDHDDDVLGIDLDAWQPPAMPGGIADGVIARMRQETTSVTTQALPVEPHEARRWRWWITGGVAAIAAAAAVVAFGVTRPPASGEGGVVAARPTHVALGPSSADLDERAVVAWRRDRYRIAAQQAGGPVTWRVDDDDTLTIETALGSIEATNASLRVEVKMLDEKKTIALSAVTSAAVALVTIVVYEGTVRVTRDGRSEPVAAGTAYQIRGNDTVIDQELVGGAPAPDLVAKIASLEAQLAQKQAELEALREARTVDDDDPPPHDGVDPFRADTLGRAVVQAGMRAVMPRIRACGDGFDGKIVAKVHVRPDGGVANVELVPAGAKPGPCIAHVLRTVKFPPTQGGSFSYPFVFSAPKPGCDAEAMIDEGKQRYAANQLAPALAAFEQAYACKPETATLKFAFAASCKLKDVAKARVYWARMPRSVQEQMLALCAANGIESDELDRTTHDATLGRLAVTNDVPATVMVDGREVGVTPVNIELAAGKHKVTYVVGDDRYTFSVVVKAGQTVTLAKQLQ